MHSFHHSRGRTFFDVFCALGMVASCVGAWQQTGATALLAAGSVAGLYGFVRLFDLSRLEPIVAETPQRFLFEPEAEADRPIELPLIVPAEERATEQPPAARTKEPRKSSSRAKKAKQTVLVELPPQMPEEESAHPRPAPLFEPEPFVRTLRAGFGRRSRLAAR